jgi:hypothetical protein
LSSAVKEIRFGFGVPGLNGERQLKIFRHTVFFFIFLKRQLPVLAGKFISPFCHFGVTCVFFPSFSQNRRNTFSWKDFLKRNINRYKTSIKLSLPGLQKVS